MIKNNCATCESFIDLYDKEKDIRIFHCKKKIERKAFDTKISERELAMGCLNWKLRRSYEDE